MNDVGQPSERELRARAARLRVDAQGASVRAGLETAGIACLLLKGRAFADLLYDADELRTYADTDLLVAERDRRRAEQILGDLGFDAAGDALADALGLPATASVGRRLSTGPGPSGATSIQWLLDHERPRERLRLVALTVFPPPHAMREFHPLARRGRWWGLAAAYALRPLHVLYKAPAAVTHWRGARRFRE